MTPVWFFYMTDTWVTPSLMVIQISAEISFWKAETCSYPIHKLVYTLAMKNIVFNQAKHKRSQISPCKKLLKGLGPVKFWTLMMMEEKFTDS